MRRAVFRNLGKVTCMRLVDTPAGNIYDFVYKYKIMTSRFVEADN